MADAQVLRGLWTGWLTDEEAITDRDVWELLAAHSDAPMYVRDALRALAADLEGKTDATTTV